MPIKKIKLALLIVTAFISLTFVGCATYYQKNYQLQSYITDGDFNSADKLLNKDKKGETGINRVLHYMNKGMVNFMMGQYEVSNTYLEKADLYNEDYKKSFGSEALSLLSNPMVKPYKPEDFETVMVHYYKSLNYLMLEKYEDALVECRRVNIQLQQLNDKYKKNTNKYANDAFAHNLMGMIYDASGDKNNAFIAYRNAYDTYENDYKKLFNISAPEQLKKDLLRVAYQVGFMQEYNFYKDKFSLEYTPKNDDEGSLVFLWMNGFGPVKSEWSINFTNTGFNNGWVTFANEDYGLNFPVYVGNRKREEQGAFMNLSFVRVAFPKYVERKPKFSQARLRTNNQQYQLELSEDINAIAFQSLKDRMAREMANSIARLATKKALESLANKENKNLGSIVSIVNALTEKADTRNWQSLPYAIHYTRIPLQAGNHQVHLQVNGSGQSHETFYFDIKKNKTTFFTYHQLETIQ
ncbi:COG3014 family protein [Saccharicrinis sp. 156]|uniref:COG3014 family protein n=1 Tax=Saccharicrinis sp. 156 TaxID=3417574 RepID=UPI003D333E07